MEVPGLVLFPPKRSDQLIFYRPILELPDPTTKWLLTCCQMKNGRVVKKWDWELRTHSRHARKSYVGTIERFLYDRLGPITGTPPAAAVADLRDTRSLVAYDLLPIGGLVVQIISPDGKTHDDKANFERDSDSYKSEGFFNSSID